MDRFAAQTGIGPDLARSQSREKQLTKTFEGMKQLKSKVDNADQTAKRRFNTAYDKIFEQGEAAYKHADRILKRVSTPHGTDAADAAKLLGKAMDDWNYNRFRHHKGSADFTAGKLRQAEESWAFAKSIEDAIGNLHRALSGEYD